MLFKKNPNRCKKKILKYNLILREQAQLGRQPPPADAKLPPAEIELWYALPGPIPGLGVNHGKVSRLWNSTPSSQ